MIKKTRILNFVASTVHPYDSKNVQCAFLKPLLGTNLFSFTSGWTARYTIES